MLPWHHVHLTHKNREEVGEWYLRYLGAQKGPGTKRSENLWYGNNLVQVQSDTAIRPPKSGEFESIGLGFPNLPDVIRMALDAGANRISHKQIRDPWGTPIELVESEKPEFHHLTILCQNPGGSAGWYAKLLGGKVVVCPWNPDYFAIRYDTMWLVFGQAVSTEINPSASRPICHAGWYTPDINNTVEEMLASGCKFPVPIRPFGPVRLAFAEDPSGLWIELVEPPGGKIPK